ncbi:MAG: helix-turn-helix transcriptional regulator [Chloroflexota bacterium]
MDLRELFLRLQRLSRLLPSGEAPARASGLPPAAPDDPLPEAAPQEDEADGPEGAAGYRAWPTLTVREMEVAWCLRLGYSNEEIANQLGIGLGTVKTHVHKLLVKFNVRSRWVLRDLLNEIDFNPWRSQ